MGVVGPTSVGKSYWVYELLKQSHLMYEEPPRNILYCYGIYQSLFDDMKRNLKHIRFHQGLPTNTDIENFADEHHNIIVLDDLMNDVLSDKDMSQLFTQGCHHRHLSVIFISQNLYCQGRSARTIALNTWYLIIFKVVRDMSQLMTLGRQLYPDNSGLLMETFRDVMQTPYSYLVVDLTPHSKDEYRLRTRVFPGEHPIIYIPKRL
jgi:hypothetical protein